MKSIVVGSGAVGAFYGSRLHEPPVSLVSCVLRSHFDAVRERGGFRIETQKWGSYEFSPEHLFPGTTDASSTKWDYVLVACKVLPEKLSVADLVEPVVTPGHTTLVLLQNGLGIERDVARRFPTNTIVSCCLYVGCTTISPGVVRHFNVERIVMGVYRGEDLHGAYTVPADSDAKIARLADQWKRSNTTVEVIPDIYPARLHKNAWNACWSVLSILSGGMTADELVEGEMLVLSRQILEEIFAIGHGLLGERFPPPGSWTIDEYLNVTKTLGPYRPSMLVDFEEGRDMEVDVISTELVRIAREKGIACPRLETTNVLLQAAVKARDSKQRLVNGE
ncbi:ketopantoate reductase PanE/ApbA-domain-containing protein [Hyaloraphidium curvatum]|nr:ketopantoate reductase PanE/ApbA-domain-containing protein [Hyaloraphidium curvatum]